MNITEFAEQIVFSNSLEDKLADPGKLTFDRLSSSKLPSQKSLRTPGRPRSLLMQHDPGKNVQPPKDDQLENENARGQLLHFLANHELLATELMALVLLKFPDAPRAFRQGVLVTLQEEQLHTRMYIKRMRECGVEFGSYPVSGQFWRIVEPMQCPMDFVSRLSLTFEQANLDYSLHFAKVFRQIGDAQTSSLLHQIYEDEISHVQHGLHWFRQWKDQDRSDWDAWQDSLEFPVSPARGRGPRSSFNREGRIRAGLTEAFIDSIEVFGQSKDRSAAVRWFDSGIEAELAGNVHPKLEQVNVDLEHVLVAVAKPDDVLLSRRLPSQSLRKHWIDCGIELPEFCSIENSSSLSQRKLNRFEPWAMSPKVEDCVALFRDSIRHKPANWKRSQSQLFQKSFGVGLLSKWLNCGDGHPRWMSGLESVGLTVGTQRSLTSALSVIRDRGFNTAVFKPDLSASGRGIHRIETDSTLEKSFTDAVEAVVEPWLERVVDLSFLWRIKSDGKVRFDGWSRQLVSTGSRYEGTVIGRPFDDCSSEVRKFLLENRCERLKETASWIESRLVPELRTHGFTGSFGVDSFVYRDVYESLKIRPFVELNPRMTMGHVAHAIEKRIANGAVAAFRILTRSEFEQQKMDFEKIAFSTSADGRWRSGVVRFGDVDGDTKLIPLVVVGDGALKKAPARN